MEDHLNDIENMFLGAYNLHADAIFRFCYFKTSDREIAKDITQDVFMKTWEYLSQGGEVQNMKAYLYKVAYNAVIDFWRKSKSVPESDLPLGFFENKEAKENTEVQAEYSIFLSVLQKLSKEDRGLVTMRYVEDMSPKEIAYILGEKENTISVRINRAVSRLRNIADGKE